MRTPTSGLAGQLDAVTTQSGQLVQVTLNSGALLQLCTLAAGFSFNSISWAGEDVQVSGIAWDAKGITVNGSLTFGDLDLTYWVYALTNQLQEARVDIWQFYLDAPGEAEPLWSGRIGAITKTDGQLQCALVPESMLRLVPFHRVQSLIPSNYLIAAGKVLNVGTSQWIVQRQVYGQ